MTTWQEKPPMSRRQVRQSERGSAIDTSLTPSEDGNVAAPLDNSAAASGVQHDDSRRASAPQGAPFAENPAYSQQGAFTGAPTTAEGYPSSPQQPPMPQQAPFIPGADAGPDFRGSQSYAPVAQSFVTTARPEVPRYEAPSFRSIATQELSQTGASDLPVGTADNVIPQGRRAASREVGPAGIQDVPVWPGQPASSGQPAPELRPAFGGPAAPNVQPPAERSADGQLFPLVPAVAHPSQMQPNSAAPFQPGYVTPYGSPSATRSDLSMQANQVQTDVGSASAPQVAPESPIVAAEPQSDGDRPLTRREMRERGLGGFAPAPTVPEDDKPVNPTGHIGIVRSHADTPAVVAPAVVAPALAAPAAPAPVFPAPGMGSSVVSGDSPHTIEDLPATVDPAPAPDEGIASRGVPTYVFSAVADHSEPEVAQAKPAGQMTAGPVTYGQTSASAVESTSDGSSSGGMFAPAPAERIATQMPLQRVPQSSAPVDFDAMVGGSSETSSSTPTAFDVTTPTGPMYVPPVGHWSTQALIDDDEQVQDSSFGRDVAATSGAITTSALVLPSVPNAEDIMGPLSGTGEILITGSINLPSSFGTTGVQPALYDHSDVDALLEADDREDSVPDSAPVRAIRAISTNSVSGDVMKSMKPSKGSRLPMIITIVSAVIIVGVIVLFVFASVFGVFK